MKIIIRADGGEGIGLGHVMRSLVLAEEFKKHHEVSYICNKEERYKAGRELIKERGIDLITIDVKNEIDEIKDIQGDFIIIDKYDIDSKYLEEISMNFYTLYIDDNNSLDYYPVDILLNHNVYGDEIEYNCNDNTVKLLGAKYTLLRNEFKKYQPIKINNKIHNILITLGGSDDANITEKLLNIIHDKSALKHVVVGPAFKYRSNLENIKRSDVKIYFNVNMSELITKVDIAISACGSTLNELSYLGVPTIGIVVADNQKRLSKYLSEKNCIILSNVSNINDVIEKIDLKKRKNINENMKKLIDGSGARRIKEIIEKFDS